MRNEGPREYDCAAVLEARKLCMLVDLYDLPIMQRARSVKRSRHFDQQERKIATKTVYAEVSRHELAEVSLLAWRTIKIEAVSKASAASGLCSMTEC